MSKLDLNDPEVWNKWRSLYEYLSDAEHFDFADAAAERFPHQSHHNDALVVQAFERFVPEKASVLEVGGWKGELAKKSMTRFGIRRWINIELCRKAIEQTVLMDKNSFYEAIFPGKFAWFTEPSSPSLLSAEVFVSTHTIEHFSDDHLKQLLANINHIPVVILEAPINDDENNWDNYVGTHILKMGWNKINEIMKGYGYTVHQLGIHFYVYTR